MGNVAGRYSYSSRGKFAAVTWHALGSPIDAMQGNEWTWTGYACILRESRIECGQKGVRPRRWGCIPRARQAPWQSVFVS